VSVESLQPGAIFGRDFRVVRPLREGGMGAVYIVDQLSTGRQRALKVLAPELAMDPGVRERFVLEARAASRIESDHVVEIVTAGIDDQTGSPFLVMELLKGEELADAAARLGPLPLGDVAEILAQVGHALEQAHAQGIVHRDLKPENIFLAAARRRGAPFTAKVLDFGIAKLVAEGHQKTGTQPLGTPLFMAPEQTDRRGRICPATDVWALGLIAFRLLVGHEYWRCVDGTLPQLLREIVVDELPYASVRAAELGAGHLLPPGFDAWFARCVHRNVDARFPEAGAAVRAFHELVAPSSARGMLIVTGGERSSLPDAFGASGPQAVSQSARVRVTPGPVTPFGATEGVRGPQLSTGGAMAVSGGVGTVMAAPLPPAAPARRPSALPIVVVGVVLTLGGGAAAFFALRGGSEQEIEGPHRSASGAPSAGASAATSASAAAAPTGGGTQCPDGMVLIQGGTAFLGSDDQHDKDASPTHEVTLSNYCLDRTEVTTAAYLKCFQDNACPRPLVDVEWAKITDEQRKIFSPFCNAREPEKRGDHPMNCVPWFAADTYCRKNKKRLPTEAEWEYAARGSDQRTYPWGDDPPDATRLNACGKECEAWGGANLPSLKAMYEADDGFAGTAPAGSYPKGASKAGVLDLAGNVWEWVADWHAPYAHGAQTNPKGPDGSLEARVIRGGDFLGQNPDWARPAYRFKREPTSYNHAIGFRCAADPT
jgi:formylglycine-generating enzyme required for sulfatase activity